QRGVQLSGYSETELRGANVFELLLFPEDRQIARAMLADVLAGEAREYEVRWKTKNGRIVHFDGATVPRLSDAGEFLSTLCTLRDVTERKCAEERLRKSEEKYRDLIEISPDAIYVVDADGVCVLGNRAGAELAGIPENELVGTPVTDTYLPEERNVFRERLEQLKTGGTLASVLLLNADGVHLDCIAGPSLPKEWAQQMENLPIGPCAGSCGTAAYRRSPVIVSDIASDPLWDVPAHRSSALKHGLRAS